MDDEELFPIVAADIAIEAIEEGVSRVQMTWEEAYNIAKEDIENARKSLKCLLKEGLIKQPTDEMVQNAFDEAISQIRG